MTNSSADNTPLRVGVAGYGTVGRKRHLWMKEHPAFEVVAVCDQSFPEPRELEGGVRAYTTADQLLDASQLDVLFVCLPNYVAADVTIAGLEHGLHVFCEKPPGRDVADIVRVREVEAKHPGQKLMYGFNHRYHDSVRHALQVIESGERGELISMRGVYGKSQIISFDSDWRTKRELSGGGILLDQGIHMVDMMRLFARSEFTDVHAYVTNDFWKHDVEDNAYALMRAENGVVAMLHSTATQWRHRFSLELTLTKGAIILGGLLTSTKSYGAETVTIVKPGADGADAGDPPEEMHRYNFDGSWRDEVAEFADTVVNDREVAHGTSLDALRTVQTVYRIYCADPAWASQYDLSCEVPVRDA